VRALTIALYLVASLSLGIVGQLSLKFGMSKAHVAGGTAVASGIAHALLTPYVMLGLGLYALSSCFWLVVLSRWQLSYAYPMVAISYVGVVLLSRVIFAEKVTTPQWIGIALMRAGLVLVARFGSSSG
jgi:uncharacterized membrane protein